MKVNFKRLHPDAVTPSYSKIGDAGLDLTAISMKTTDHFIEYGTGITIEIPDGYAGFLFPRSSVTNKALVLKNSIGLIDSSYRGEIKFRFLNALIHCCDPIDYYNLFEKELNRPFYSIGERIGQLVILPIPTIELVEKEELSETNRGAGGFGSTGN